MTSSKERELRYGKEIDLSTSVGGFELPASLSLARSLSRSLSLCVHAIMFQLDGRTEPKGGPNLIVKRQVSCV